MLGDVVEEFVAGFDWSKVNTVGPIFDLKKLDWLNGHYIRSLTDEELADRIVEHYAYTGQWSPSAGQVDVLRRATPLISERLVLLSEALPKLQFLFTPDDQIQIAEDAGKALNDDSPRVLDAALDALGRVDSFDTAAI